MPDLTGREKATLLLAIIGPQKASQVLRRLPEEVSDILASRIASLPQPSQEQVSFMWSELSRNILAAPKIFQALPTPEKVESVEIPVDMNDPYARLNAMLPFKLVEILKNEKPRVQKIVISLMNETKAKEVVNILDHSRKKMIEAYELEAVPLLEEIKSIVLHAILNYHEDLNGNH